MAFGRARAVARAKLLRFTSSHTCPLYRRSAKKRGDALSAMLLTRMCPHIGETSGAGAWSAIDLDESY